MRLHALAWAIVMLLALPFVSGVAVAADASRWELPHTWFTPALTVNANPHCDSILIAARHRFLATEPAGPNAGFLDTKYDGLIKDSGTDDARHGPAFGDVSSDQSTSVVAADGTRLFVYFNTNPGCGGACETQNVIVSARPYDGTDDKKSASTPTADTWAGLKGGKGEYYFMGIVDGDLELYRVASPTFLKLSCRVALKPAVAQFNSDPTARRALLTIEALIATTTGLSRGAGDCGSMRAADLDRWAMEEALHQTLYRPWALIPQQPPPPHTPIEPEKSYDGYKAVYFDLDAWSAGGLVEWRAFRKYNDQHARTIGALAAFYAEKYRWSKIESENMAHMALTYAISKGFAFDNNPFPRSAEIVLRKAILRHKPIAEVEAAPLDVAALNQPRPGTRFDEGAETVLDVAVEYPDALAYLLSKGLDPNQANDFGKTPLMYAIQYNQAASVALLLKSGADPNAYTIAPSDRCYYTLGATGIRPLHYAARYASGAIIRSLLANGAVTFVRAASAFGTDETPLDWLRRYTAKTTSVTANPFISADEVPALAAELRVPGDKELAKIVKAKTNAAEAAYAAGQFDAAYRSILIALAADPNNRKAISNLPLIALKSGRLDPAAEAAANAIDALKSPAEQAAAWFDMGLACEQSPKQIRQDGSSYSPGFDYNGAYYCFDDRVKPFMRAWQAQPTRGRAEKLEQVLAVSNPDDDSAACVVDGGKYRFTSEENMNRVDRGDLPNPPEWLGRIYVLRPAGETVDPATVQWGVQHDKMPAPTMQSPHIVGRYALGDQAITVLGNGYWGGAVTVDGKPCGRN